MSDAQPKPQDTVEDQQFDEYEEYNYNEKLQNPNNSGKNRTKKEVCDHTNRNDPSGHSRKILTKLVNMENNKKEAEAKK